MQGMEKSGWREWLALPEFNISQIEVKIDTGTRTSILHTSFIETFRKQGSQWVRFGIHPDPERTDVRMIGFAPVKDQRLIKDAEGSSEVRFIVETQVRLGEHLKTIDLSLTQRDSRKFRMILGRSALQTLNLLVDSGSTFLFGPPERQYQQRLESGE